MPPPGRAQVSFECLNCGKKFTVPATLQGRASRCSACGKPIVVPSTRPATAVPARIDPDASGDAWVDNVPAAPLITPFVEERQPAPTQSARGSFTRIAPPLPADDDSAAGTMRSTVIGILMALGGLALVGGAGFLLFNARDPVGKRVEQAVRAAASVVPAVRPLARGRVISQAEVDECIRTTKLNDVSSSNVYQQMATYARGTMNMSSLAALAVGAAEGDVKGRLRAAEISEVGTRTVHQQKAAYLEGMLHLLALAARASGASAADVEATMSRVRVVEAGSDTVHQQCANYCSGCLRLAELMAIAEGVASGDTRAVMSQVEIDDAASDTVHQQTVTYLSGLAKMLALAGRARGASASRCDGVLTAIGTADIAAKTVYQQEVNRLDGILELLGAVALGR
jgi:DNA-directed RNA polymerase subunit RPC12/RpoP